MAHFTEKLQLKQHQFYHAINNCEKKTVETYKTRPQRVKIYVSRIFEEKTTLKSVLAKSKYDVPSVAKMSLIKV